MEINKAKIKDWLFNGWEHWMSGSEEESVDDVVNYLLEGMVGGNRLQMRKNLTKMINHWVENQDNERINIFMELDLHKSEEMIEEYIQKFINLKN